MWLPQVYLTSKHNQEAYRLYQSPEYQRLYPTCQKGSYLQINPQQQCCNPIIIAFIDICQQIDRSNFSQPSFCPFPNAIPFLMDSFTKVLLWYRSSSSNIHIYSLFKNVIKSIKISYIYQANNSPRLLSPPSPTNHSPSNSQITNLMIFQHMCMIIIFLHLLLSFIHPK